MITTQYTYLGEIIANGCNPPEPLPTFLRVPTRATLDDLLAIKLDTPKRPFVFVDSIYTPKPVDWDSKLKDAFLLYHKYEDTRFPTCKNPKFARWQDQMRWKIYSLLKKLRVTF